MTLVRGLVRGTGVGAFHDAFVEGAGVTGERFQTTTRLTLVR